jgi:hypothetical protein
MTGRIRVTGRVRGDGDAGAALIAVLIIVTVLSLGLAALLSFTDTSIRSTVALRAQAAEASTADGAAEVAVRQLRDGTFTGGCDTATTPKASAAVRCTPDPANTSGSGGNANSSPGNAILTLGTSPSEYGIYLNSTNNQSVKVKGGIFSNSTIYLDGNKSDLENIATNSYVYALGACAGSGSLISTPAPVCNYATQPQSAYDRRGKDPGTIAGHGASFDAPPAPTVAQTPPACTGKAVYELQPGLYTSATQLNALTNSASCSKAVFHLNPGRYYFNFKDPATAHKWTVSGGYLVGGTPTATLKTNPPPTIPGSCVVPGQAGATTTSGVELVFGADSRFDWTKNGTDNANIELCASNSDSGPPVAVYGLKQSIGSGAMLVPAQSGCVIATGYPAGGDATHCAILQSYNDPNPSFTVRGTVYAPSSMIDLYLNNNTVQVFRWGLVSRGLRLGSTGSTGSLAVAVIDVPDNAPAPFPLPRLLYLEVFVCPGASTCTATGTPRLRVKVVVSDSPPSVSVVGWSYPR